MPKTGFFTRTEIKSGSATRPSGKTKLSAERLNQLGLAGVRTMNPKARTPNMQPSGPDDPILYFLGEAPGCISGDSLVDTAFRDKSIHPHGVPIRDLVGKSDFYVYSFDITTKKLVLGKVKRVWKTGRKKVYRVRYKWRFAKGKKSVVRYKSLLVTSNHRFLLKQRKILHDPFGGKPSEQTYVSIDTGLEVGHSLQPFNRTFFNNRAYIAAFSDERHIEARYLLGKLTGSDLLPGEDAHHVDKNSLNDTENNLSRETTASHARIHGITDNAMFNPVHRKTHLDSVTSDTYRRNHSELRKKQLSDPVALEKHRKAIINSNVTRSAAVKANYKNPNYYLKYLRGRQNYFRWTDKEVCRRFSVKFPNDTDLLDNHVVTSIEYVGEQDVYDMEVEKYHNFAVNGIFVHNSDEDDQGEPFVGKSGQFLRSAIPRRWVSSIRFDNCCRTRPVTSTGKNRPPEFHELECFRPSVIASIETARPWAVVGFGNVPLNWAVGDTSGIINQRGRRFATRFGKHVCWFYPVMHPSFILRTSGEGGDGDEDVTGDEWEKYFKSDLKRVFDDYRNDPGSTPDIIAPAATLQTVVTYQGTAGNLRSIENFLQSVANEPTGIDIETSCLRPYEENAKLLSVAIASRDGAIAFAWDHVKAKWSESDRKQLRTALINYLSGRNRKVAHNLSFELEWFLNQFGESTIWGKWDDTMVQAYHLDSRSGGQSLDFLCKLHFGAELKKFSNLDRSTLASADLNAVLKYNALDAAFTMQLFDRQRAELKSRGLLPAHNFHTRRVPALVLAQSHGMPVDVPQIAVYQKKLAAEIKSLEAEIKARPEVKKYEKLLGTYDPHKPAHFTKMLRDIMHRTEGEKAGGKYSTDKRVLAEIADVPMVAKTLKLREAVKLKSTYVDTLDRAFPKTIVHPDGKIHTIFNHTYTVSRRLSSRDPNMQNFPKRKNADVRSCINPGPGRLFIACDYGALEARGIAMASRDEKLVEALWTNYDIHMAWAKRIIEEYPDTYEKRGSDLKAFRSEVKNQMVFPAFYGAGMSKISRLLEMPQDIIRGIFREFWATFRGVKQWQKRTCEQYERTGYVETLTGFRRYGPMSMNMQINTPIQGTGSDIVIDAMTRLAERAYDEQKPWLAPCLNIHDDLTSNVPIEYVESAAETIVEEMTKKTFDFINVPLVVEMSIGANWADMKKVGDFRTDEKYDSAKVRTVLKANGWV